MTWIILVPNLKPKTERKRNKYASSTSSTRRGPIGPGRRAFRQPGPQSFTVALADAIPSAKSWCGR